MLLFGKRAGEWIGGEEPGARGGAANIGALAIDAVSRGRLRYHEAQDRRSSLGPLLHQLLHRLKCYCRTKRPTFDVEQVGRWMLRKVAQRCPNAVGACLLPCPNVRLADTQEYE